MATALLPARAPASASTPDEIPEVLIVLSSSAGPYAEARAALETAMKEWRPPKRGVVLSSLGARELETAAAAGTVFVAVGLQAAATLQKRLPASAPLAYLMVSDAEALGLTSGTNRFGVTMRVSLEDQVRLIQEALPDTRTVGLLYRSGSPSSQALRERTVGALPRGWRIQAVDMDACQSVASAIDRLLDQEPDLVWTGPDSSVYDTATIRSLLRSAMRNRIPVFGFSSSFVRAGALLGTAIEPRTQARQTAELLAMLPGLGPGSEPTAERPRASVCLEPQFQIAVNLRVAELLGVELPPALVSRAGYVEGKD